jgi:hypothetical protein
MNLRALAWKAAVMAASVTALQAHPGHPAFSEGAKHFVTSPNHFMPALLFAVALGAAAQLLKNRGERNFTRAIAAMIALAAMAG